MISVNRFFDRSSPRFTVRIAFLFFLAMFGCHGCAVLPPTKIPPEQVEKPVDYPRAPVAPKKETAGPADSLYKKANESFRKGNWDQAEVQIERALRIEPGNGYYWYTLAQIKFEKKEFAQTLQLCRKSRSLAAGDENLGQLCDSLISQVP